MEIIQVIWIALLTESKELINILLIPSSIIEVTISMLLFTTILNISSNIKQKILYILSLSILSNIINFFIPSPLNIILRLLIAPLLIIIIFKTKLLRAFIAEIIPYILITIFEITLLNPFLNITHITMHEFQLIPIYKFTFVLSGYLLLLIIYFMIRNSNLRLADLSKISKKDRTFLFLNFTIGLIAIWLQTYLTNFYSEELPPFIKFINILVILSYFFIIFYRLNRNFKITTSK